VATICGCCENRDGGDDLRLLPVIALEFAADQEIEFLIGAAHLDVGFEGDGIVTLGKRVHQFVHGNRDAFLEALGEIVSLQDAGHCVLAG
jgi:hypothetical protein